MLESIVWRPLRSQEELQRVVGVEGPAPADGASPCSCGQEASRGRRVSFPWQPDIYLPQDLLRWMGTEGRGELVVSHGIPDSLRRD